MPKVQTIKTSNMLKEAMHAIHSRKKIHLSDGSMTFKCVPDEEQYDSETMEMSYQLVSRFIQRKRGTILRFPWMSILYTLEPIIEDDMPDNALEILRA
jgi:hypothetical protein